MGRVALDKRKLWRDIEKQRKAALAVRLAELKGLIAAARAERHAAVRGVQLDCAQKRDALREDCARRKFEANALGLRGIERAQHIWAHEKQEAKAEEQLGKRVRKTRTTKKEAEAESDSAVMQNLDAEMGAVFGQVKRHIKGGPRKSRTEAFLEWAADHPSEVYSLQQRQADKELAKLIAEEERGYRELRRRRAANLAPAPF